MGNANKDLTLQNNFDKFEDHFKPQANELRAHCDLLKKLKQAGLSCAQFFTVIQNQLSLCQYPTETHTSLKEIFSCLASLTKHSCQKASLMVKTLLLLKYDKDSKT